MVEDAALLLLLASALLGGWTLRSAAAHPDSAMLLTVSGWLTFVAGLVSAMWLIGPVRGPATAAALAPTGSLLILAAGWQQRAAREGRVRTPAPEPLQSADRAWRGVVRFLLAGPVGMLAAMGVAFCVVSWAPGAVITRLLIAALLVPALWGVAMTWTLADRRLIRATAVLVGTAVAGFGLALLKGVA